MSQQQQVSRSPKQILQQDICHKYGWSCAVTAATIPIQKDGTELPVEGKQYVCTVIVGYQKIYTFTSGVSEVDVYQHAIDGLQTIIQDEEQKPAMSLREFLSTTAQLGAGTAMTSATNSSITGMTIPIYDSHDVRNWDYFWSHKPTVVGIDTEGNNCTPPILIQIAVIHHNETYCIIEAPLQQRRKSHYARNNTSIGNGTATGTNTSDPTSTASLSYSMQRLLNDTTIVKVFCDNFAHKDKIALGIHTSTSVLSTTSSNTTSDNINNKNGSKRQNRNRNNNDNNNNNNMYGFQSEPPQQSSIIDLECVMNEMYGPVTVARGLSRIVSWTIATQVRICKSSSSSSSNANNTASAGRRKNVKKFVLLEQGKIKPITNLFRDLSPIELQYAADDVYATLLVYNFYWRKRYRDDKVYSKSTVLLFFGWYRYSKGIYWYRSLQLAW